MNTEDLTQLGLAAFSLKPAFSSSQEVIEVMQEPLKSGENVPLMNALEETSCVLVGSGLSTLWQDDMNVLWRLLENIFQSVSIDLESASYFDTDIVQTEEAIFSCIEEVIESGVECIYTFEEEHELVDQLQESLSVIFLPSLEAQVQSGASKRECYQALQQVS